MAYLSPAPAGVAGNAGQGGAERTFDLATTSLRELNQFLHRRARAEGVTRIRVAHPDGAHSIACGLDAPLEVDIQGHVGYYVAGMNKSAQVTVHGNAGPGAAENMIVDGDASLRCGISLKGGDIVVGGSVGSFSAFMAQAGRIVVCGDAGDALGDSLYEAVIYVRGKIRSLGADARIEPMTEADHATLHELLAAAGFDHDAREFQRVASARSLYHWHADADQEY